MNGMLMMKTIMRLLDRLRKALIFLPFFLFVVAAICGSVNLLCGWDLLWAGHDHSFYFLPAFPEYLLSGGMIFVLLLGAFLLVYKFAEKWFRGSSFFSVAAVLFLAVLLIRLPIAILAGIYSAPFSDFEASWELANGCAPITMCNHQFYPAWVNFSAVEKALVGLFGSWYGVVLIFGAVLDGISAVSIFGIAKHVFNDKFKISLMAAFLYIFNPSSVVYVATATPEHLCIACFTLATFIAISMFQNQVNIVRCLVLSAVVGLLAGIGNAVKPFFPLFAAALFLTIIMSLPVLRERIFSIIIATVTIFVLVLLTSAVFTGIRKHCFSHSLNVDPTPHFLCVGLNRQGEGQIHLGSISRRWAQMMISGKTEQDAARTVKKEIINDWEGHWSSVFQFLVQKMVWAWQDDNMPFRYLEGQIGQAASKPRRKTVPTLDKNFKSEMKNPDSTVCCLWRAVQTAALVWYIVFLVCCARGVVQIALSDEGGAARLFVILLILGFCGMMVLCEAQSRYKCFVLPYACVIGSLEAARFIRGNKDPCG